MNHFHPVLLFFLLIFFGCNQPASTEATTNTASPGTGEVAVANPASGANVVYINSDTLLSRYEYFRNEMGKLEEKEQNASNDLNQRGRALEQEYLGVQKQIQEGLLTPNQIAKEEQRLTLAQQEILAERERLSQELLAETDKLNQELRRRLDNLLGRLREENNYDFVLQYGQGSNVLMVNEALDITDLVLQELNSTAAPVEGD